MTKERECEVVGCKRTDVVARGRCWKHYQRWRRSEEGAEVIEREQRNAHQMVAFSGNGKRKTEPPQCSIEGCERYAHARGWCRLHYGRWKRTADPTRTRRVVRKVCSVEGCDRRHHARGLCSKHYNGLLRDERGELAKPTQPRKCRLKECANDAYISGWCKVHFDRFGIHHSSKSCPSPHKPGG